MRLELSDSKKRNKSTPSFRVVISNSWLFFSFIIFFHCTYWELQTFPLNIKERVDLNIMVALSFDIDKLIEICRENDAAMVGVFGSVARGEDTFASDIDLMVKFSRRKSLLDIVKLERKLSTVLGKKVDLLTEAAISPLFAG